LCAAVRSIPSKLTASLRDAPVTIPALAALALFVIWATSQAGYPLTHWAPGGLLLLALLGLAVALIGLPLARVPPAVKVALACLVAYTALSFLSILWAGVPGDAWEGADRTLLYLLVFALFACWPQRGASATLLLAGWCLALTVLAAFVALHVNAADSQRLQRMLPFGRLVYPTGYANANAALWLMAFWPASLLARSRQLPWLLRGVLAGAAVLLADVALLGQSRGSLYATPLMLMLVFALAPARTRTFATLVPIAGGIAVAAPALLRVGNHLNDDEVTTSAVHGATVAVFASAVAVAVVVSLGAAIEQHQRASDAARIRVRKAIAAGAVLTLIGLLAGGWVAAGDPVARLRHGWDTFKSGRGYAANSRGSRLTSGLGSNRYDFYRVALDEFVAHPLVGIGADNFAQQYLEHGRSQETPHYPHSVELRALTETGIVGALLAAAGLGAALAAGARTVRRSPAVDPLAADVAVAALGGFAYWAVHGSFDWFWEFAGLGAAAFALLGLACALAPAQQRRAGSRAPPPAATVRRLRSWGRPIALAVAALASLAAALSLAAPWLSRLEVESATRIWTKAPRAAYARLDKAASLNPMSAEPPLLAGSIALRFGDLPLAQREFAQALARSPDDAYATLELGAIASSTGSRMRALALLARAAHLNPRDALTRQALAVVRAGRILSVADLNRSILRKAHQLG